MFDLIERIIYLRMERGLTLFPEMTKIHSFPIISLYSLCVSTVLLVSINYGKFAHK